MLTSGVCDYNDVYILIKWTVEVDGQGADPPPIAANRNEKQVIFKNLRTVYWLYNWNK